MGIRLRQSAFTLLELLVAMALMAAVTTALYISFRIAFRSQDRAESALTPPRTALETMELMRLDIESAMVPDNVLAGPFEGTPQGQTPAVSTNTNTGISTSSSLGSSAAAATTTDYSADGDTLTFYSCGESPDDPSLALAQASGQTAPANGAPVCGDIRMVTYALAPQPNDSTGTLFILQRSITTNLLAPETPAPEEVDNLCENVLSLHFQYFDGTSWWPNWDSTQEDDALPTAVQVTLELQPPVVGQPNAANPPLPYQVTRIFMPTCCPSPINNTTQGSQGLTAQ